MSARYPTALAFAAAIILSSSMSLAQNMIGNGSFNTNVSGWIFADGFESGDLSLWSTME